MVIPGPRVTITVSQLCCTETAMGRDPGTDRPEGKLRLLYEAHPLAFVAERAGGLATDGRTRILDKAPSTLHERTPLFLGSPEPVEMARRYLSEAPVA